MRTGHRPTPQNPYASRDFLLRNLTQEANNTFFIHRKDSTNLFLDIEPHDRNLLAVLVLEERDKTPINFYARVLETDDVGESDVKVHCGYLNIEDLYPIFNAKHLFDPSKPPTFEPSEIRSLHVAQMHASLSNETVYTVEVPSKSLLYIAFNVEQLNNLISTLSATHALSSPKDINVLSFKRLGRGSTLLSRRKLNVQVSFTFIVETSTDS